MVVPPVAVQEQRAAGQQRLFWESEATNGESRALYPDMLGLAFGGY